MRAGIRISRSSRAPTARAVIGIDAAIDRAHAMIEAGADVTFVESPISEAEMARIAKELPVPQIANIVHGGKTPDLGRTKLADMGFARCHLCQCRASGRAARLHDVLAALKKDGSLKNVGDRLAGFDERQRAVAKHKFDALEKTYQAGALRASRAS